MPQYAGKSTGGRFPTCFVAVATAANLRIAKDSLKAVQGETKRFPLYSFCLP